MQITIRNAELSDHSKVKPLFEELDRIHREHAPWLLQAPDCDPRPRQWLEQIIADPLETLLVANSGEECVGLATLQVRNAPKSPLFIPQQCAVVDTLIVHPDWRRRGVARLLYRACEGWARERAVSWVEINVYEFNSDAREFYEAAGFSTTMRKMTKPLGATP